MRSKGLMTSREGSGRVTWCGPVWCGMVWYSPVWSISPIGYRNRIVELVINVKSFFKYWLFCFSLGL